MSKFWEFYESAKPRMADAVDDVRHKVVEEGWFGRKVSGEIGKPAMVGGAPEAPAQVEEAPVSSHSHATLYTEIWGKEPAPKDIYGTAPVSGPHVIEPPKAPAEEAGLEPDL